MGDGLSFPWLSSLFNRLLFENAVDLLFNLLLVSAPLLALATWFRARFWPGLSPWRLARRLALGMALLFACLSVEALGSWQNPLYSTDRVVNYRLEQRQLEAEGKSVRAQRRALARHRHRGA